MNNEQILTPEHHYWNAFTLILGGPGYCDFDNHARCNQGSDFAYSRAVLQRCFPGIDVEATLQFFRDNGAFCDCEVLYNIDPEPEAKAA